MQWFETLPTGERKPTRAFWVAIALCVVALVVVVIAVVMIANATRRASDLRQLEERTQDQVQQAIANCDKMLDPEGCKYTQITEAAISTGVVATCDLLSGAPKDDCVFGVARATTNPEACSAIAEEAIRVQCQDSLYRDQAYEALDADICRKLSRLEDVASCQDGVLKQFTMEQGCAASGMDQAYCDARAQMDAAVLARNPSLCLEITIDEVMFECLDGIGPADRDHDGLVEEVEEDYGTSDDDADSDDDGLNDKEELEEGTDPLNPDTDGDSFLDGGEVAAGYNPLGPGTDGQE